MRIVSNVPRSMLRLGKHPVPVLSRQARARVKWFDYYEKHGQPWGWWSERRCPNAPRLVLSQLVALRKWILGINDYGVEAADVGAAADGGDHRRVLPHAGLFDQFTVEQTAD